MKTLLRIAAMTALFLLAAFAGAQITQPWTPPPVAYQDGRPTVVPNTGHSFAGWTSKPPITPPVTTIDPECGTALHGDKGKCVAQVYVVRHRGERCALQKVDEHTYLVDCAWARKERK